MAVKTVRRCPACNRKLQSRWTVHRWGYCPRCTKWLNEIQANRKAMDARVPTDREPRVYRVEGGA